MPKHNLWMLSELESEPTPILVKARGFVKALRSIVALFGRRHGSCPHCKSDFVKRHGTRSRKVRGYGGKRVIAVQRWRCCHCRKTWSEPIPGVAPFKRYARAVIRRALDTYVFGACSYRGLAQLLRSEINGTERARNWDPEGLVWPPLPEDRQVRLCHTTVWRWFQDAGRRANSLEDQFGGIGQSGVWTADSTLAKVKGVYLAVLVVADAVSRVVFEVVRIVAESEEEVLKKFARLRGLGVDTKGIKALVSDGAEAYRLLIEGVMKRVVHQRCVFHLWRNLGPSLRKLKAEKGQEAAEAFKRAIRGVWDAASYDEARQGLETLMGEWSEEEVVESAVWLVRESFEEAVTHLKGVVPEMPRTSNISEWVWRGYKRRQRVMGQLMGERGLSAFNGVWPLYINFERYQKRKERKRPVRNPGHCPLEMAGGQVEELSWLDVLAI